MRLIDADALIDDVKNNLWDWKTVDGITATTVLKQTISDIGNQPTIEPEPHWIPCSERLPEESGEYLCTLVGIHNTGLPSECGYELPNNRGIISGWSTCEADGFKFLRDDEVLAWMSLPEQWRGGE